MTTGIMTQDHSRTLVQPASSRSIVRQALLVCGLLSSLLYIATDILGGLRYDGYSFTSQAISELAAIGAPSKPFVDPLFIVYARCGWLVRICGPRRAPRVRLCDEQAGLLSGE
jgi:hypothetical protein